MRLKFPYERKPTDFGSIPTVKFWLSIVSPTGLIPFFFLFDTGADVTSLPVSAAEKLGVDLENSSKVSMGGYEGTTINVYRAEITVVFNQKLFKIPCVFNPNEEVPLLLGRAGILDRFTIILDAKGKEAVFEESKR